jgi:all-trans-retinol dehydrogenase (NAD+)
MERNEMSTLAGANLLITGAAQGMGKLVATLAAERGAARLILWDVRDDLLSVTAEELRSRFPQTVLVTQAVDVWDTQALLRAADAAGPVDILLNNAGVIVGKPFVEHATAEIDHTIAVNTTALMYLTRRLLPAMIARGRGHIVNFASAAGLVANPGMSVYCASKWAVVGWSESLLLEMREACSGVHVTTVIPYYVKTGMFAGVTSSPLLPQMEPGHAARKIIRAIEKDQPRIRIPWQIYTLPVLKGLLPAPLFDLVIGKGLGVYQSMKTFTGRNTTVS